MPAAARRTASSACRLASLSTPPPPPDQEWAALIGCQRAARAPSPSCQSEIRDRKGPQIGHINSSSLPLARAQSGSNLPGRPSESGRKIASANRGSGAADCGAKTWPVSQSVGRPAGRPAISGSGPHSRRLSYAGSDTRRPDWRPARLAGAEAARLSSHFNPIQFHRHSGRNSNKLSTCTQTKTKTNNNRRSIAACSNQDCPSGPT